VSCDRQGRIALAQELLDGAGIRDRVILVGAIERIQIWDPQAWEASRLRAEEWLDAFEAIEKRPD